MALILWSDKLSVGVESIDARHGMLVETLNELNQAMERGQAKSLTEPLLHRLLAYTRDLFSTEEAMLANTNFPQLAEHLSMHRDLTGKIERYVARFDRGEVALSQHLLNFMRDWLTNHIQHQDRVYSPCLMDHGIR
ncbi:MAG: bacteriohemerythrin [Terracidiphilus sp.]